ncbi:HAD family hydrolase [Sphingobacterium tabacisoli]|uniref:HAD family hydrolase n=1 Tax=Sphingobacterium tabacisoli TaxID=2044855 RepID=A0ABW5L8V3_9SPHI|nr:HAD family hydrolase [Sphingobacterium tabacisoli]
MSDFDLSGYFEQVIESAGVGIRKPDPGIFQLAVDFLKFPERDILVIGDSYHKDIVPGNTFGCRTLWIKGKLWGEETHLADESAAGFSVRSFKEASDLIQRLTV